MKIVILIINLFISVGVFAKGVSAQTIPLPPPISCVVVYPDGWTAVGNEKNGMCEYGYPEDVQVFYQNLPLNSHQFVCELNNGSPMFITKTIYRNDEYRVNAFGHTYFGYYDSVQGIANKLLVVNPTVDQFEPMSIMFDSNSSGEPSGITVYLQGGRAPLYMGLQCKISNS